MENKVKVVVVVVVVVKTAVLSPSPSNPASPRVRLSVSTVWRMPIIESC